MLEGGASARSMDFELGRVEAREAKILARSEASDAPPVGIERSAPRWSTVEAIVGLL